MGVYHGDELANELVGLNENNAPSHVDDGETTDAPGGFFGYGDADTLIGGFMTDYMDGGAGDDSLLGGKGNDAIYIQIDEYYGDTRYDGGLHGGDGSDFLDGGAGSDLLYGDAGNDTLIGGDGADCAFIVDDQDSEAYETNVAVTAGLYGGDGEDRIFGGGGTDLLDGGNGNDSLVGGAGDDNVQKTSFLHAGLYTEFRDEEYNGGLWGGSGNDTLDGGAGVDLLNGGEGNDRLKGGSGDDRSTSEAYDDDIEEYSSVVTAGLFGGRGNDTLDGGAGDDDLWGDQGNDLLIGGSGKDRMNGGSGKDNLQGGAGNDTLQGNEGNDRLFGGDGNDRIGGGVGTDTLTGDGGADSFVFSAVTVTSGVDLITDFGKGRDLIILGDIDANSNISGNQKFKWISTAEFSGKAGEVRYDISDGSTHVYLNMNGDKSAEYSFTLLGVHNLTASDFVL